MGIVTSGLRWNAEDCATDHVDRVRTIAQSSDFKPSDPRNYPDTAATAQGGLRHGQVSSGRTTSSELKRRHTVSRVVYLRTESAADEPRSCRHWHPRSRRRYGDGIRGIGDQEFGCLFQARHRWRAGGAERHHRHCEGRGAERSNGCIGGVIRNTASRGGLKVLAKSNIATAVAAGLIEVGIVVYDYAKGTIDGREAGEAAWRCRMRHRIKYRHRGRGRCAVRAGRIHRRRDRRIPAFFACVSVLRRGVQGSPSRRGRGCACCCPVQAGDEGHVPPTGAV